MNRREFVKMMGIAGASVCLGTMPAEARMGPIKVIFSENDYGCGWEGVDVHQASEITRANSFKVGTNIAAYAAKAGAVSIRQIRYTGDYNPDPGSIRDLVKHIKANTTLSAANLGWADLGVTDLSSVHMLYMTGHYSFTLSEIEVAALKEFLDRGGFLFVDDCNANTANGDQFEVSFVQLLSILYPGIKLKQLPVNHAVYSSCYPLDGTDFSYTEQGLGTEWNTQPLYGLPFFSLAPVHDLLLGK